MGDAHAGANYQRRQEIKSVIDQVNENQKKISSGWVG
jgi:hypothetical protein